MIVNYRTHEDDPEIPKGKAIIVMNDNGFVGTNNGWPMMGQPALYPLSQAIAITQALTFVSIMGEKRFRENEVVANPDDIPQEFYDWMFKRSGMTMDHSK